MRTVGTFHQVFEAAKEICLDINGGREHSPINPVIRETTDGKWMLESGLDPEPDLLIEITLDEFESYFYESMVDNSDISEMDISDFVQAVRA